MKMSRPVDHAKQQRYRPEADINALRRYSKIQSSVLRIAGSDIVEKRHQIWNSQLKIWLSIQP